MLERFRRKAVRGEEPLGRRGEAYARKILEEEGLVVLAQNFRIPRGEVDLIARDGDTIIFVEVKTRLNQNYGKPYEAVGPAKQRKITLAAEAFLKRFHPVPACRFDVVSITQTGSQLEAEWIRDAFETG